MLRLDWLVRSHRRVSVGASRNPIWVVTKLGIRALGSLVSSHKNRSSRVLRNGRGTPLLFFERLQDFRKIPFFLSFVLLLGSIWYLGDTNWYLTIFTLFRGWLELEQRLRQHQHQHRPDKKQLSQPLGLWLEKEQRQEAVVEVVGGRPLEEEDEHLARLILGR